MSLPPLSTNPMGWLPPEQQTAISTYLRENGINTNDPTTMTTAIRSVTKQFFPHPTVLMDHPKATLTYDPDGDHLLVFQEKNHVEQLHHWLVKDYDWNFDTLCKVIVIGCILASWGAAYFALLAVALIQDCFSETPRRIEIL